jgi:hypothetical protein
MIRFSIPISFPGPEFFIEIESHRLLLAASARTAATGAPLLAAHRRFPCFGLPSSILHRPRRPIGRPAILLRYCFCFGLPSLHRYCFGTWSTTCSWAGDSPARGFLCLDSSAPFLSSRLVAVADTIH